MHDRRIAMVQNSFKDHSIDALFLSNYYNILYLTGFKTLTTDEREAFVLVTKKHIYLFTDARYVNRNLNVILKLIEPGKGLFYHLQTIIIDEGIHTLGIESEDLRVYEYLKLQTVLSDVTLTSLGKLVIQLRVIKEQTEIDCIKKACQISDDCLKNIISTLAIDDTERKIAFRIEKWIKEKNYDLAFDPIVAVNEHSAIPHYHTKEGDGKIKKQSVVLIDFGVKYENYLSDMTRMVFLNPTTEMMNTYNILLNTQNSTIQEINKVQDPKLIDSYCRNLFVENKLPNFPHSLGHGVGLEIHEFPKLSSMSTDTIQNNHVFTIEPGVYLPNKWGLRIEDMVSFQNNKVRQLTLFTKQPIILQ